VERDMYRTFRKEPAVAALRVPSQKPAIAKVVVALDQLNTVSTCQTELVGTPGLEFICTHVSAQRLPLAMSPIAVPEGWRGSG
jgi:hypothetical protein